MSSDDSKQVFSVPSYGQPPMYYYPAQHVQYDAPKSVSGDEALARALQAEENSPVPLAPQPERCRYRRGCCFWRKYDRLECAVQDDGRPLGNLTSFIQGLVFGTFAPFLSLVTAFGFETSKLLRTGVIYGTANCFLILGAFLASHHNGPRRNFPHFQPSIPLEQANDTMSFKAAAANPTMNSAPPIPMAQEEHERPCFGHILIPALILFVLGLITFCIARRSFRRVLAVFATRQNKTDSEQVKVISEVGSCRHFVIGFLASFFFSFIGAALAIILGQKYLKTRYGAINGMAVHMIISGVILLILGVPPAPLLAGLFLIEISCVHFKRAIISAQGPQACSFC